MTGPRLFSGEFPSCPHMVRYDYSWEMQKTFLIKKSVWGMRERMREKEEMRIVPFTDKKR